MNPITTILEKQPAVILDGALATELERRGYDLNDPLWSAKILISTPEAISVVHTNYLEAGADCIITASYQASFEGFIQRGYNEEEAMDLIASSVHLARQARDRFWSRADQGRRPRPLVAASVGPYGAFLADGSEYSGDYGLDEEALVRFHRKRLATLTEAGPDILACETIPSLLEAKALVRVLQDFPEISCWMSFSAKNGKQISNGEAIETCAEFLNGCSQVAAIGINCTAPDYIESLIERIRSKTTKPVVVYPNNGDEYDPTTKTWRCGFASVPYGERAKCWFEKGAQVIGGCCRTTPDDIRQITSWVRPEKA